MCVWVRSRAGTSVCVVGLCVQGVVASAICLSVAQCLKGGWMGAKGHVTAVLLTDESRTLLILHRVAD